MFYNTPKNLNFRGALSCNELRGGREKLSTIGVRNGGKLLVRGLHGMIFGRTFVSK